MAHDTITAERTWFRKKWGSGLQEVFFPFPCLLHHYQSCNPLRHVLGLRMQSASLCGNALLDDFQSDLLTQKRSECLWTLAAEWGNSTSWEGLLSLKRPTASCDNIYKRTQQTWTSENSSVSRGQASHPGPPPLLAVPLSIKIKGKR